MPAVARRFSLVQMLAVTTATAAGVVFFRALFWPPLGSSGLAESRLPAVVLVGALWFCGRGFSGRMVVYAVVGTFLAVFFCLKWLGASGVMFRNSQGPPPWIIVSVYCAYAAMLASGAWFAARLTAWYTGALLDDVPGERSGYVIPMLRGLGMGGLVLVSVFVGLVGGREATDAWGEMDSYVEQRLVSRQLSVRQWAEQLGDRDLPHRAEMAEVMASHFVLPDDEAAIPTVAKLLDDDDLRVRRAAAVTLHKLLNIYHLGAQKSFRIDGPTLARLVTALDDEDADVYGRIAAALRSNTVIDEADFASLPPTVVPVLVRVSERPEPELRGLALAILEAMGPKAADAHIPAKNPGP